MNIINLKGEARNDFGKQASRNYRKQGMVPCVMYGGEKNVHFVVNTPDIKTMVYTPDFHIIEVELEGKVSKAVVKDIQFHPVTEIIEHIDFQELVEGKKVRVGVPVKLEGDSPGVKEGGSLVTVIRKLDIKASPEHLVTEIKGDISGLDLNQSICIRDMEIPEGIELMQDPGSPVGYIEVPRSLKSAESTLEEGEEGEEGEGEEATTETEETTDQ